MLRQRLADTINRALDRGELAGCNLEIIKDGRSLINISAGCADIENSKKVSYDSIFRLYSQTKPVTAAAVALLVERGQLDVGAWVSDYLPGFNNQKVLRSDGSLASPVRPASVGDLLSMTAGLCYPGGSGAEKYTARLFGENQKQIDAGGGMGTVEFMNLLGGLPLAFDPGSEYKYSTCADVLGAIVEIVSGVPFGEFLKQEFFEPLGMKDTGFYLPQEKLSRLVTAYMRSESGLKPYSVKHLCVGDYTKPPRFESGGAGLVSTLGDYARFATMLINGGEYEGKRYLSRNTVAWLTKPQLTGLLEGTGYSYGKLMRVCVYPGRVNGLALEGEYGWDGWLGTYFINFPNEKMTFLFNQNTKDTGTSPLTRKLRNIAIASL